jgi:hypothetical protein
MGAQNKRMGVRKKRRKRRKRKRRKKRNWFGLSPNSISCGLFE